jgi:hypothetical protein
MVLEFGSKSSGIFIEPPSSKSTVDPKDVDSLLVKMIALPAFFHRFFVLRDFSKRLVLFGCTLRSDWKMLQVPERLEYSSPGMIFIGFQSTIYSNVLKDVQGEYILLEIVHSFIQIKCQNKNNNNNSGEIHY